ncbi:hypothetical protein [Curtobacterium sp. TXMA1]|uniref:hypothetical protein n=1 Tax=Curtobacterium sp. TXMA1 TaxID=2876939 RepID=UPI001CCE1B6D|nr:hypothetical protein [Curtobacterium sp. TXMA1]UBQ01417.1 hypothetical protein LCG91_09910 [Curtobacterium sp. TXMA1]
MSTRMPSLTALRLLTPCTRSFSWLGTSVIANPAADQRQVRIVSISNPSPQRIEPSSGCGSVEGSSPTVGRVSVQNAL